MKSFDLKKLLKNLLPFINAGNALRLAATLPGVRNRVFIIHQKKNYSFRDVLSEAKRYARFFAALRKNREGAEER